MSLPTEWTARVILLKKIIPTLNYLLGQVIIQILFIETIYVLANR